MAQSVLFVPSAEPVDQPNPWFVFIYPGISGLPPVKIGYRQLPPKLKVSPGATLYVLPAGLPGEVFARAESPDRRYFEVRAATFTLYTQPGNVFFATGDATVIAEAGPGNGYLLQYETAGLPAGIYDLTFDMISDGVAIASRPIRVLSRVMAVLPAPPSIQVATRQLPPKPDQNPNILITPRSSDHRFRAGAPVEVFARVESPNKRYFELTAATFTLRAQPGNAIVVTGAAVVVEEAGAGNGYLVKYAAASLPAGVYDLTFGLTTDGTVVESKPIRVLSRVLAAPSVPPTVQVATRQLPPKPDENPNVLVTARASQHLFKVGEPIEVFARADSPNRRYFEVDSATFVLASMPGSITVLAGDAEVVRDPRNQVLLAFRAPSLPKGVYDLTFNLITAGTVVDSRPIRVLVRP